MWTCVFQRQQAGERACGHVCFKDSRRVNECGHVCFKDSRRVNESGHVCFKDSRRVNECGHVCFKDSRRVNEHVFQRVHGNRGRNECTQVVSTSFTKPRKNRQQPFAQNGQLKPSAMTTAPGLRTQMYLCGVDVNAGPQTLSTERSCELAERIATKRRRVDNVVR
jgi:hypothetical protein